MQVDLVFRRVRELIKDSSDPKDEIVRKGCRRLSR
jgi:hypothetical protein